ncbi:unnamed protein product [Phaedon cochleariae]|uniref:Uncharacterized protein n=1 Tax=Phaedon cochleariae TaxID=80249 RepID=A0A9N9SKY8_PHACE|nr:unnamed protein product [Phaedon cochleariae]
MYDFYYDFIKSNYGESASLCYSDTDSLKLHINTDNVHDDIKDNSFWFDTSNYTDKNIHNIPQTKSVVGKFKDQYSGTLIESFYGTGAEAYCVQLSHSET